MPPPLGPRISLSFRFSLPYTAWQLTVGDREGYGTEVVGADTHSDINLLLVVIRGHYT